MKKASLSLHFEYFQYLLSQHNNPTGAEVTKLWEAFVRGAVPNTCVGLGMGKMKKETLTPDDIKAGITESYIKTQSDEKRGTYTVRYQIKEDKVKKTKTFVIKPYTPTASGVNNTQVQQPEIPYTLTITAGEKSRTCKPRVLRGGLEVTPVKPAIKAKDVAPAQVPVTPVAPVVTPVTPVTPENPDGKQGEQIPKTKPRKKDKVTKVRKATNPTRTKKLGWGIAIAVAVLAVTSVGIWHGNKYIVPKEPVSIVEVLPGDSSIISNNPLYDITDPSSIPDKDIYGGEEDHDEEDLHDHSENKTSDKGTKESTRENTSKTEDSSSDKTQTDKEDSKDSSSKTGDVWEDPSMDILDDLDQGDSNQDQDFDGPAK